MNAFASLTAADLANQRMVDRLIAEGSLWSVPVIQAFRQTPRHRFLDRVFLYQRKRSQWRELRTTDPGDIELKVIYSDRALVTRLTLADSTGVTAPVSSSSQPSLMAEMLEDLRIDAGHKVLEVGAGTGYNAALMACLVGTSGKVSSVEVDRETLADAWVHLRAFPDRAVTLEHADGRQGFAADARYDRIMVTASTPDLEPAWLEQLTDDGLLLAPISFGPGLSYLARGTVRDGVFHGRLTRPAYFMPLRPEAGGLARWSGPSPPSNGQALPAPWADWFGRNRPRLNWSHFSYALAFYGWLRGLEVSHHGDERGVGFFGVHDASGAGCYLGLQEWRVLDGNAGRDLAWQLWRAFLDAGGPRPTDFRIRAGAHDHGDSATGECHVRRLPRYSWRWELSKARDRSAGP